MKRIKSGEGGIVDLGTATEAPTAPQQPAEGVYEGDGSGSMQVTGERAEWRGDRAEEVDDCETASEWLGSKVEVEASDLTCPNCGTNLSIKAVVTGTMKGSA